MNGVLRRIVEWGPRICLFGWMAALATMKAMSGHHDDYLIPEGLFHVGVLFEATIAVTMLTPRAGVGACGAILMALLGIVLGLAVPDRPCGCAGRFGEGEFWMHMLLCGVTGGLAVLVIAAVSVVSSAKILPGSPSN